MFAGCSSLTSITIPNKVVRIEYGTFWNCISLTDVIIPDSVTSIGNGAFWGCSSLTDITVPDSVTSIGASAFYDCIKLEKINYNGMMYKWKKIDIDRDNRRLRNCKITCIDGSLKWNEKVKGWVEI